MRQKALFQIQLKIIKKIGILLIIVLFLPACISNSPKNKEDVVMVKTQKLCYVPVEDNIKISATIEGNQTVRLGFLVPGKINHISIQEGESIKRGQLLASIDPESYAIAEDIADANADQMQDDYNRVKELYNRKSVSESEFVKITNGLKAAKAQQKLQAKNLSDTKIFSPISGILLKKGVEEGEIIDKGLPLFAISDIFNVKAVASIPEMELKNIKIGNKAFVHIAAIDSTFIGTISDIGTVAEPSTRTFTIKVALPNPQLLMRPGMTAEVDIPTGKTTNILTVPVKSILNDASNNSYVYTMDTDKNIAIKREISVGKIIGDQIEIISGLSTGDLLIVSGQHKVVNGTSVIVK